VRVGRRFGRALIRHVPSVAARFPNTELHHIIHTLRDRDFVIDARTPFYPGMSITPSTATYATLDGVVDDLALVERTCAFDQPSDVLLPK
jgi:hypothetical protein